MPNFFNNEKGNNSQTQSAPDSGPVLSEHDVIRFRKQRGINLGSWFTLERWIAESPFRETKEGSASDLDVANGRDAKKILEAHWDNWIKQDDWQWISDHGYNTVRIPIGYYHVCGLDKNVLKNTDFEEFYDVYEGAWKRIASAIKTANLYGIGVLIDLHAAPGGQNKDPHSGTNTGQVNFWKGANLEATVYTLKALVRQLAPISNVVGIELVNEPANNNGLQAWYESTLAELRRISPDFPLYISDAWDANWYSQIVGKREDFVVLDHHLYRCFTEADQKLTAEEHASVTRTKTKGTIGEQSGKAHGNFVVAEWSAALNPASLSGPDGEKDRQRRVFVAAQLEAFECCAGWFWWTYKKEHGWDAGWSVRDAVQAEIMPKWHGRRKNSVKDVDDGTRDRSLKKALDAHINYWATHGGKNNEPWRFEDGFSVGWADAQMFIRAIKSSGISELGFKGEWTRRRAREHVARRGGGSQVWEFEHGFGQGYDAAISASF